MLRIQGTNNVNNGKFSKEEKMKKLLVLLLIGLLPLMLANCGPDEVAPEIPPEEPPDTTAVVDTIEPEPEPEPEPVVKKINESEFITVYFDFDKYNLVDSAKQVLEYNARILKNNMNVIVKIEGHCDERGTVEYNLSLGDKRAAAAKDYLVGLGIKGDRIQTISYGKSRPAVMGSNEAAWAKNRRAQFRIVSQ
jgi:peptidoglycan-associated lipoprotein